MRKRVLFAMSLLILLTAGALNAGEVLVDSRTNIPLTEFGATHVKWEQNGEFLAVTIARDGFALATIDVVWTGTGIRADWRPVNGDAFVLVSTATMFQMELADGRIVRRQGRQGRRFLADSMGAEEDFAARTFELEVIGDALSEIESRSRLQSVVRKPTKLKSDCMIDCGGTGGDVPGEIYYEPPDPPTGGSGGYRVVCNGPTYWGEAYDYMARRSTLCQAAKADANGKCMNSDCTGCCAFGDCNAYCQAGDYFCQIASIEGTSCSRAPL